MTSIDELFKSTSSGTKRKLTAHHHPAASHKSAKVSHGDVKDQFKAQVEDETEADNDEEAGPQLPPDEDPEPDDDEEGRFFGGGVNANAADALDYLDAQDTNGDAPPEEINAAWIKRTAQSFEKRISKNAELRSKFETEPQKFMESEAALDNDIKIWSLITDYPALYPDLIGSGTIERLTGLLAHENTDIAVQAVTILAELTDEDVPVNPDHWDEAVAAMLEADLPSLLTENLSRLNEEDEADQSGVFQSLSLLENLSSSAKTAESLISSTTLLRFLQDRITKPEKSPSQNKQYAAEVLAILLQTSPLIRQKAIDQDAVESLLQLISAFRRKNPNDSEEEEYAENLFNALTTLCEEATGKLEFLKSEGAELCLLLIKEGKFCKSRALRVLDHAAGGILPQSTQICERIIDKAGLKPLFSILSKKSDAPDLEHVLGILSSMLRHLPGDSAPRIRLLAKFLDKDYEKITRLIELRRGYLARLEPIETAMKRDKQRLSSEEFETAAMDWLSRRLDAGLFSLQTIDVILSWLVAEDGGAQRHAVSVLGEQGDDLSSVKKTILEQLGDIEGEETTGKEDEKQRADTADMLRTLIGFLD